MGNEPVQAHLEGLSENELVAELQGLEEAVYQVECFGVSDIVYLEMIYRELDRRGLADRVRRTVQLDLTNDDEEGEE